MSLLAELAKRDRCRNRYGYYECQSGWYYWGRWVLAGIALLAFFLVLLSCCLIARRRRRRGTKPMYGTGWMAPPPKYSAHQGDQQIASGVPPPGYDPNQGLGTQQPQHFNYDPNLPYVGLQRPPNAYNPDGGPPTYQHGVHPKYDQGR